MVIKIIKNWNEDNRKLGWEVLGVDDENERKTGNKNENNKSKRVLQQKIQRRWI